MIPSSTAIELVQNTLVRLSEVGARTGLAMYPFPDYHAPGFIILQAEVPHPREGRIAMNYFSANLCRFSLKWREGALR